MKQEMQWSYKASSLFVVSSWHLEHREKGTGYSTNTNPLSFLNFPAGDISRHRSITVA